MLRPFRFGVGSWETESGSAWTELARRAEALGYATLLVPDHYLNQLTPVPALTAAAAVTTTLRVGCTVFANDFRHPALLAKEAATIDLLSGGRFEFGLGAGWHKDEYDQVGIPFDPPAVRVARMAEGLRVVKGLWGEGAFSFAGAFYTISGLEGTPKAVQVPHPPVYVGGGGKRLLSWAAREADIVGFVSRAKPEGGIDWTDGTEEALARKVGWVRAAAGERFDQIELSVLLQGTAVTDRHHEAATALGGRFGLTAEQVLASTEFAVGTVEQLVERMAALRERHGISYLTVGHAQMEAFAPVVARLGGR